MNKLCMGLLRPTLICLDRDPPHLYNSTYYMENDNLRVSVLIGL